MNQGLPGEGNLQGSRCAELCATTRGFTEGQFGQPSAGRVHSRLARLSGNCRNEPCGPDFSGSQGKQKLRATPGAQPANEQPQPSNHETSPVPFLSRSGAAQTQPDGGCDRFLRSRTGRDRAHQIHGHPMRPRPLDGGRLVRARHWPAFGWLAESRPERRGDHQSGTEGLSVSGRASGGRSDCPHRFEQLGPCAKSSPRHRRQPA